MIDAHNLKKVSWTLLTFLLSMIALGPSNLEYFWRLYLVVALLAILWTLYLVYFCERFTVYMISLVVAFLGAFCLPICSVAYLAAGSMWGKEGLLPLLLGCAPVGITLLAYYALARGRPSFHPFEYNGLKVQPRYQDRQRSPASYNPVLVAGATTLAASITINSLGHLTAAIVAMVGLQAFCIAALFHARHIIRGLRALRLSMHTPYTFMQIDQIREARRRWYLGRLFALIASWRKSPDN
jgi:hypothetical protein